VDPFVRLPERLNQSDVRYVVIGVWGINYCAQSGGTIFTTRDRTVFLPPDAENLAIAWNCFEQCGLSLVCNKEPLDRPHDVWLRRRVFIVDGVNVPVAPLKDLVISKAKAGREKDRLFLATHKDALKQFQRTES
jgi:hypothetical protein